ncbi:Nif3-like dinuclear metal center hexameric protein [Caloramator sp. Dgby_cultured_2]
MKTDEYIGSIIIKAIKNDINIYAVHTNFDNAEKGLNDF